MAQSRFWSGRSLDSPNERDDSWRKAEEDVEEQRRRKANEGKEHDGKSLYEILQANKAAKQEAFQESIRLKNQIRPLDEDEAEFLDQLLESTRAEEDKVRQETVEQLEIFRQQREESHKLPDKPSGAGAQNGPEEQWTLPGRKRRRMHDNAASLPGVKAKRTSLSDQAGSTNNATKKGRAGETPSPPTRHQPKPADKSEKEKLSKEDSKRDDKQDSAQENREENKTEKPPERASSPPKKGASDAQQHKTSPQASRSPDSTNAEKKPAESAPTQPRTTLLGLGDYDSDDD